MLRLTEVLADIHKHPRLGDSLVLKGGSALNLFFGPPERLSVDLDFNYVRSLEREAMLRERPLIERALVEIVRAQGYGVQLSGDAHAGRKFYLDYSRFDGLDDRVEIDVNYMYRICLLPVEERSIWRPGEEPELRFPLLSFEEIAAGKLLALLDRVAPRDAWDVARIPTLSTNPWPGDRLRSIFVAFSGALPHPLHAYDRSRIERLDEKEIQRRLHPMLRSGHRPRSEELVEKAWAVVRPFLDLTPAEREYIDRLQSGDFQPQLLFPEDAELAERLQQHPVLLWKAKNATEHAGRAARPERDGRKG
ncbi:MAG: nucleotidyl transferase AbiEii/AbiGii toxin family protein [Candidatus Eisenbacteria bacterium]